MDTAIYDIAVIGGGPAGLIASAVAATNGAAVVLLEKNKHPGKKLLITGKGRCNITNADYDPQSFIDKLGKNGKYFLSGLHLFSVSDTIDFFSNLGVESKVERGNRVFPVSEKSSDVVNALVNYANTCGVIFKTAHEVIQVHEEKNLYRIVIANKSAIYAHSIILCTGGLSYPHTGSTGTGYEISKKFGHTITKLMPSLVPVVLKEKWVKNLSNLTLKNVSVSLYHKNKRVMKQFGDVQFTDDGIGGPVVLDISRKIIEITDDTIELTIDLKPALNDKQLNDRICRDFTNNACLYKNYLKELIPVSMIPVIIELSQIDPNKNIKQITHIEKKQLAANIKNLKLHIADIMGYDRAIITNGGVSLNEIDMRTMRSKKHDNLYFAGEIIDLDGPTGGYNLQICWTTGYISGKNAAMSIAEKNKQLDINPV